MKFAVAGIVVAITLLVQTAAFSAADGFYALIDDAMARMHVGMHVSPSGNVDRDFAKMMIPHHQGAIDMAVLELRFGRDPRLRRLAQEIIVTQGQEVQLMQAILHDGAKPAAAQGK